MTNRRGRADRRAALVASALSLLAFAARADILHLRDGSRRAGALAACVGETCSFSGSTVPIAAIAAIAFGDLTTPPPAPSQSATDEVHLAGGAIVVARVVGISLGVVATEAGSHDRAQVSWVLFAAPTPGRRDEPPIVRPTATPSPTPTPAPTPTPTPPPTPTPTVTPPPPRPAEGERGALWTGTITGRNFGTVDETFSEWRYSIDVRLREIRHPLYCTGVDASGRPTAVRCGTHLRFASEGSRIRNVFSSTSSAGTCSGRGEVTVTEDSSRDARVAGGTWHKSTDRDFTAVLGVDIPTGATLYIVGIAPRDDAEFEISCSNGAAWQADFVSAVLGWIPSYGSAECSDQQVRFVEGGGILRGAHSGACTGCCPRTEVSWSICREGIACPPPELPPGDETPPDEPRRPCDETAPDRAQLDLLLDQWRLYAAELLRATAEVDRLQAQAAQWSGDFEHAMRDCDLWGFAQLLIGVLSSGLAGAPATATELAGFYNFLNYAGQLEKIASGDPSWLLPSANTPVGGSEWLAVENYYDAFVLGHASLGSAAPQELRQRLQGCGAPTLEGVLDGAYAYLRLIEELKPLADRMHEQQNRLRDKEESILDFCLRHPQACEDYEACRDSETGG